MLTQKRLKEALIYNPQTGVFMWKYEKNKKVGRGGNRRFGLIAGAKCGNYTQISIDSNAYLAHRLAWFYMYGFFPENDIDHIDRNGHNNRRINLREVSRQCNIRNSKNYNRNKSGVKGVSFCSTTRKWVVFICVNYKNKNIGSFSSFLEAVCHRLAAEQALNWSGCDSSSPAFQYVKKEIMS